METVEEKIAHLKGLAEGLDIFTGKDGKVYTEIIDIIANLDDNIQHITNRLLDLEEYVDAIDEDLNDIENEYYDENTSEDFENLLNEDSNNYDSYDEGVEFGIDDENADLESIGKDFFQIKCPNCKETVIVDYAIFDDSEVEKINCPNCKNQIIVNIDVPTEE